MKRRCKVALATGRRVGGLKRIEYDYDLISGKVNLVKYQHGANDRFYYQYKYDAKNRVTEAWSGTEWENGILANAKKDAQYKYYLHGPLARTELGVNVQGLDYAYTIQGWLKGMNSQKLDNSTDPVVQNRDIGRDGVSGNHASFNRDEVAFSLHYFGGDFTPLGGSTSGAFEVTMSNALVSGTGNALYNGNISRVTTAIRKFGHADFKGYSYRYDQLNRLKSMRVDNINVSTDPYIWNIGADNAYKEDISYDANGNIITYVRNGAGLPNMPLAMDNLNYSYKVGTNQLLQVSDDINKDNYSETLNQTEDLDGENKYEYDKIGNLIRDRKIVNGVTQTEIQVEWNVYGKIKKITKNNGLEITYHYDAAGNRVRKSVLKNGLVTETWYSRDAQGNTFAVYSNKQNDQSGNYWLEQHLFGSARLGVWNPGIDINNTTGTSQWSLIGKKSYEIANHLGNVLAVVSDKNVGSGVGEVLSASDYYPFGMMMPGRKFNGAGYRFGFNGKENDNEVKGGEGLQQDYGMRIYDPRLGRFLSVDPITKDYPMLTPYQFASNRPIDGRDLDGLEYLPSVEPYKYNGTWLDYLKAIPNAAGKIYNEGIAGTWNSGVNVVKSIKRGTAVNDIKQEFQQASSGVKKYIQNTIDHATDPISAQLNDAAGRVTNPENLSNALALYGGLKLPSLGNIKIPQKAPATTPAPSTNLFSLNKQSPGNFGMEFLDDGLRMVDQPLSSYSYVYSTAGAISKNGLTEVGRALQKHAGREGSAFGWVKYSHKTANKDGMDILKKIGSSENKIIQQADNGGTLIFDKTTGMGFGISREGAFNGFRELPKQ